MSDLNKLQELCRRLGASPKQAETMAKQLLKRSAQLAAERNISLASALEHLLRVVVQGRQGEVPPEFQKPPPSPKNRP